MTSRNPFIVPGSEDYPDQPLSPWEYACHENYYSNVGGQHEAIELFKEKLPEPSSLARASRMVIVTGPELGGKTSLANRCVRWMQTKLDLSQDSDRNLPPETERYCILSLRGVCRTQVTLEGRMEVVCGRLTQKLRELETGSGKHLVDNLRTAHDVLPLFGHHHRSSPEDKKRYFIILLPSLELEPEKAVAEVEEYRAALAGVPGILCVTESSADNPLKLPRGEGPPPISLHLRYLRIGESHTLVNDWPNTPKEGDGLPIIREEDLNHLEDELLEANINMTVGKLLTAVRKIYNHPDIVDHTAGKLRYVEYSELIRAYLGQWDRPPNPQRSV